MNLENQHDLTKLLIDVFGYSEFRPGQLEIIETIVSKKNVLAVMPTGAGKSLCYQLPAIYSNEKTIVVSPLVALIDDQVSALSHLGVKVSKLHSGLSREENVEQWRHFSLGTSNILYLSPERLMQPRMIEALQSHHIGMFVVDEAHCISKWGADFRPDYEELAQLKRLFPRSVIAAFTATADKATRADIVSKLTAGHCEVFVKGFDRPNLSLKVLPKQDLKGVLLEFLDGRRHESGIVYCLSRNETDHISEFLKSNGFNSIPYHAGKSADYRRDAQNRFMTDSAVVMVATVAFGMGIDKPDIRYIVHASMPSSVESFYQEIGRAGRDGGPAETILFYGLQDIMKRQRMIFEGEGSEQHKLLEYKRLEALIGYCETTSCRRLALLSYFDETVGNCENCDNCLSPPDVQDYTELARILLAAIKETGQFFGAAHIIDVVRGSETAKVRARNHDRLESYGMAADKPKQALQSLIRQLVAANALRVNLEKYGALEITDKGNQILLNRERFVAKAVPKLRPKTPTHQPSTQLPVAHKENSELLIELKNLRLRLAKERSVPAFVIFSDKSLIQMANEMPTTEREFLSISGVGKTKLKEFYGLFSEVILSFTKKIKEKESPIIPAIPSDDHPDETNLHNYSNPPGHYFKLEEQDSFSPLNARASGNFPDDLQAIYKKRTENIANGRMINHGMPFTEEERDDLISKFSSGQSIKKLADFYQRTANAIEIRLEQLGLINKDFEEVLVSSVDQCKDEPAFCVSCGEVIPTRRLEIMPGTQLCVDCQEENENAPSRGTVFPPVPAGLSGNCPRCQKGIAVVYQNSVDKNFFVGCSKFPNCRWSAGMD
jgi:ATP-dependent DNA helicase RecQ